MKIIIKIIPHTKQRYETVGDWKFNKNGNLHINVSDMQNDNYAFLVGLHEMIEAWLCKKRGIKEEDITAFDMNFELNRKKNNIDEPGDSVKSPYHKEHVFATTIEKMVASILTINWNKYSKTVTNL